jgi:hypothetical protein
MPAYTYHSFDLRPQQHGWHPLLNGAGVSFQSPVTKKTPKIYVVSRSGEILYIGQTSQPIGNRLRQGFQGYYGYAWGRLPSVRLHVFTFDGRLKRDWIEGVEGEMVFRIRMATHQWPPYQTEIHFRQVNAEQKRMAVTLLREVSDSEL